MYDWAVVFSILLFAFAIGLAIWLLIRSIVLWYFRINRIVELLEQIERNTRSGLREAYGQLQGEEEYYFRNGVRVTSKRLIVPPHEWHISQFQPVRVQSFGSKYRIYLLDKSGRQIHHLESDSEERIYLIADAINKAIKQ
ncbi:MAG: hypothetical protein H3C34_03280 [Caldilineaceae bacterium]|nr:hypothetical protein [Caldilineaceae bacterium]